MEFYFCEIPFQSCSKLHLHLPVQLLVPRPAPGVPPVKGSLASDRTSRSREPGREAWEKPNFRTFPEFTSCGSRACRARPGGRGRGDVAPGCVAVWPCGRVPAGELGATCPATRPPLFTQPGDRSRAAHALCDAAASSSLVHVAHGSCRGLWGSRQGPVRRQCASRSEKRSREEPLWRGGVMKGLECVKIDFLPKLMKK